MLVKSYPIVFSFRDLIAGNGFVVGVEIDGRALLVEESSSDVWLYGVQPGGVAGGDATREVALMEFKRNYLSVLFDMAAEADSFESFEKDMRQFFFDENSPNAQEWAQALARVRAESVSLDDMESVNADERPPRIEVHLLDTQKLKPSVNEFDCYREAA